MTGLVDGRVDDFEMVFLVVLGCEFYLFFFGENLLALLFVYHLVAFVHPFMQLRELSDRSFWFIVYLSQLL